MHIRFADWRSAERLAVAQLGPALAKAEAAELLGCCVFIRKVECWCLRYQAPNAASGEEAKAFVAQLLDSMLLTQGQVTQWRETIDEPRSSPSVGRRA